MYEAQCLEGAWSCGDGVLLDSCGVSCGDEAAQCLDQCGGSVVGEASCSAGEWTCAMGVPTTVCEFPCGTEPLPCVPSCEVFELHDSMCVEGDWSCGDGVLAADCWAAAARRPPARRWNKARGRRPGACPVNPVLAGPRARGGLAAAR